MRAAFLLLPLLMSASGVAAQSRTYLASVVNIRLGPHDYVDKFSIDTWGVTVIATCQIPAGWTITAGNSADPTGTIAGEASLGVTYLDPYHLKFLQQIVLVRMDEPVRRRAGRGGELPATFAGFAEIGTYGPADRTRKQILTYRNLRLTPAIRCPMPRR